MEMKKVLDHLPITDKTKEEDKPEPISCKLCGKERKMLFLEIPLVGKRWVHCACECEKKEEKDWEKYQASLEKNRNIRKILRLSSSMEQLKSFTWDNLYKRNGMEQAIEEVKKAIKDFQNRGKEGLLLFGESGSGKTHLTAVGANELLSKGYSVIFITEKDLLTRFRETDHFNNKERFYEIMDACLEADLLVWDDFLSSQKLDKKEKDWIFQVINGRERADKPIWYTSNLTVEEFQSGKYAKVLDDKERTWWRVIGNNTSIFNRATNYRKLQAISRAKGISIHELEGKDEH